MPHLLCLKGKKESYVLRPGPALFLLQYIEEQILESGALRHRTE